LKKKLLSPSELRKFRAEQVEARRLRAEQLEKNNKKLAGPKELFDPKPVVEVAEESVVEVVKEPIELLQERVEDFDIQYSEDLAQLKIRLASKVEQDDINLVSVKNNIKRLGDIIDELPEVKYYDDDLEKLTERVDELQVSGSEIFEQHGESLREIKKVTHQILEDLVKLDQREIPEAFDPTDIQNDIVATKETFYERVTELKKELSELPEIKYYDDELTQLQEKIEAVKESIPEIPEIKYYDDDLDNLLGLIEEVRGNVSQLPEVKYYEGEIAQLEKAIKSIEDRIPTVPEVRYYEDDIGALREEIKNVEGQIAEVSEIPEIKYYDEEVEILSEDINKVRDSLIDIKLAIRAVEKSVEVVGGREIPEAFDPTNLQIEIEKAFYEIEKLKEKPVTVNEDIDSLVSLDQKFVSFDDLAEHYRTFIVRIQQQLMSLGGGGETQLKYLDDIVGIATNASAYDGKFLKYNHGIRKFVFETVSEGTGSQTLDETLGFGNTSSIGMSVGVTTATKLHVDPVGSGVTYNEDLVVQGNARVTGILSIGTSSIVLDSNAKEIRGVEKIRIEPEEPDLRPIIIKQNAEKIIFVKTEEINGEEVETETEASVGIGSTVSINTTGIITASSFFGDGSGLTGIVASGSGVVVQNTGSDVGTASTINFGSNLDATFSGGVATINVSIPLSAITDVNTSNLSGITTDYLMVYDPTIPGFKFVNPKTYFGINNDANPAPDIVDYGVY